METSIDEPPSQLFSLEVFTENWLFLTLGGLSLLFLLLASALISGSEVAFFSLDAKDVAACKESNKPQDKKLVDLITKPKLLLATILIINNFVNVGFVTLSTFITWTLVDTKTPGGEVLLVLTVIVTTLLTLFGELVPKIYANLNNLNFARMMSSTLGLLESVFKPLSFTLMSITNVIDKRFAKRGYDISVEELNQALEITTTSEDTTNEEKDILKGIVNFSTLTVKQVMKSRMDITALDTELNFHQLMDKINKSGFSRIPIYTETIDKIDGILYIKDLLPFLDQDENYEWQKLIRSGFFVPETKKIDVLLKDFQEKRVHMAIVVDEYGGTSGLITLEDIIEEIVGEINDEFDDDDVAFDQIDSQTYIFEGKTTLNDFCKVVDISPSTFEEVKGESESLGGLLLEINTKLPLAGEQVYFDKFIFTVTAVDAKRIKRIKVFIKEKAKKDKVKKE